MDLHQAEQSDKLTSKWKEIRTQH